MTISLNRRAAAVCLSAAVLVGGTAPANAQTQQGPALVPPVDVTFDFVPVGTKSSTQTATIKSVGTTAAQVERVTLEGRDSADFAIQADTCTGRKIAPGATCTIGFTFTPKAAGTRVTHVRIEDTTQCDDWITLAGSGTATSTPVTARAATCEQGTETTVRTETTVSTSTTPGTTTTNPGGTTTVSSSRARCVSRRRLNVRLNGPKGSEVSSATATLNGKSVKVRRANGVWKATVDLRGLKGGRYTLRGRLKLASGKTATVTRRYSTCVTPRDPS